MTYKIVKLQPRTYERLDLQKKLKGIDDALATLETDRAKELY